MRFSNTAGPKKRTLVAYRPNRCWKKERLFSGVSGWEYNQN
jgi:hypothetical protein